MHARLWSSGDSFSLEKYPTTCAPFLSTFRLGFSLVYLKVGV